MAGKADGQIIIDSEIQTDGMESDIQAVRKSLDRIVDQLEKLEKAFRDAFSSGSTDGAVNAQNKLQKEINETESDMSGLKNAAESASDSLKGSVDGMTDSVSGLGETLDDIDKGTKFGNIMQASENLSGAGNAIIDFGKATIQMSSDIQSATSRVNGYFGLTGQAAEDMQVVLENVFKTGITDNMDEVAEATILVKNNLKDLDNTSLENITTQAINLEKTFGSDMSETMRGVSSLMTNFGLDAQQAMDLIVSGTQNGLDKTQELGDNLSEYSGKFAQAGYSAEEYFQLLNNGLEGGFYNLDKVNDAINEVTTRLADGTIEESIGLFSQKTQELFTSWQNGGATQKEVIDSIVSDISSTTNQQEAMNMAAQAFGTMAEDGGLKAISSLTSVGNAYDDVTGKAEALGESTTTPMQELQAAVNDAKVALAPLGTTLLNLATKALPPIVDGISKLVGFFTKLPGPVQTVIVIIGIVVAAFLVLAPAISAVATVVLTLLAPSMVSAGAAAGTSAIGFGALSASLLPIIAVIALIVAAVIAVIAIIKNWGAITDWFKEKWQQVTEFVSNIVQKLTDFFVERFTKTKEFFQNIWNSIVDFFTERAQKIYERNQAIFNAVKDFFVNIFTKIRDFFKNIWESIVNFFVERATKIQQRNQAIFTAVKDFFVNIFTKIKNFFQNIWNTIKNIFSNAGQNILTFTTNTFNKVVNGIRNIIGKVTSVVKNGFQGAINFIKNLPSQAFQWGKDIIQGIINGLKNMLGKLGDMASNVAGKIRSFLHFSVPDEGPLSDADEYGPDFMKLLADGMAKNINKIKSAAQSVAYAMIPPEYEVSLPYMAQGVIAPATTSVTNYSNSTVTNNSGSDISQLASMMRQFLSSVQSTGGQQVTVKVNRKTLFDMMIDEAKLRQGQTGQNAFEL